MLGLGHRHTIAGHNRHAARRLENVVGVIGVDGFDLAFDLRDLIGHTGKTGEQHVAQGAVHGLAHNLGQDDARGAHQGAGDDQHIVVDGKARGTGCQSGVGVEQGYHHRHIRPADGDYRHDAEYQGQANHHIQPGGVGGLHDEEYGTHDHAEHHQGVNDLLAAEYDLSTAQLFTQFAVGDQ